MPQVVEFPAIGSDPKAQAALVRVSKEVPAKGEPFRQLRSRLREGGLWERERPTAILRFLGTGGATAMPSIFMQTLAAAPTEDDIANAVLDRTWQLNPLIGKAVFELTAQRAHSKDEIYKYLASPAYRGIPISRPQFDLWLAIALAYGLFRPLGVAVVPGPRSERYIKLAAALELEEFLAEDRPEPEPSIPSTMEDEGAPGAVLPPETSIPAAAAVVSSSPLPAPLRHLTAEGVPSPRNRERPVPTSRFTGGFSDEVLAENISRIAGWSADVNQVSQAYHPSDFDLDTEAWVERPDEVVYRLAVGAALAFRLDRDRASVVGTFQALDKAGVLGDLYQGTVPENLPAQLDARALMLASLAARRCAEVPDLAAQLDGRASAAEAFASLDAALGRGLFRTELFWIMDMLGKLGVLRYDDLGDVTVTPHRIVRDTLFRLGFIDTPYASDGASLTAAARAARRAVPEGAADELLVTFTLACGCAYDCPHRKTCDYACRERLE